MQPESKLIWRSPEEIVEIAFQRASVVMMNEAHSALQRCIRTRKKYHHLLHFLIFKSWRMMRYCFRLRTS
jgi:hypothetical protein